MTVIFDLDGTLVDSKKAIAEAINEVRERLYGLPPLDERAVLRAFSMPNESVPGYLYGTRQYEKKASILFEKVYTERCYRDVPLFDGVKTLIRRLKTSGCSLYVATNAPTSTSKAVLEGNGVADAFTDIVGADRVANPKPSSDMIRLIVADGGREKAWMIGDTFKDREAAKRAGIGFVYAAWGYGPSAIDSDENLPTARLPEDIMGLL
ncbi:MAG: HAD family hydrolase [Epsilonproteobacteria bacterium]|nr:HAD family hydrolase [Campylobacterota bacterium]